MLQLIKNTNTNNFLEYNRETLAWEFTSTAKQAFGSNPPATAITPCEHCEGKGTSLCEAQSPPPIEDLTEENFFEHMNRWKDAQCEHCEGTGQTVHLAISAYSLQEIEHFFLIFEEEDCKGYPPPR